MQDTAHQACLVQEDLQSFNARLLRAKTKAKKKLKAVSKANQEIIYRNAANPSLAPKPLLEEPYVPQLVPADIDVSQRLTSDFKNVKPRRLPLSEITGALTKLGLVLVQYLYAKDAG